MSAVQGVWIGLSVAAAAWGAAAGVPLWLSLVALTFAVAPSLIGIFVRGAMPVKQSMELQTGLFIAVGTLGVAFTGGAVSPLIVVFAAAIGLGWSSGQPRLAVEAGAFSILGYVFAAIASIGGNPGVGDLSPLAAPYALAAMVLTGVIAALTARSGRILAAAPAIAPAVGAVDHATQQKLREASARASRAENQLDAAIAEAAAAKQALEARTRFFAQTSHELRTPLNAILGFAEMMKLAIYGPLPEKYEEYAGLIHEGGRGLSIVIDDVLDLSRIDAGHKIDPEPISLTDHAAEAVRFMADTAARKSIRLEMTSDEDVEAFADPKAVRQIALNLISNALKFTPEGGEVSVTTAMSPAGALLAVSDTGVGITEEELTRLSRAFEQGEAGRKHKGAGLGLSVVRAFAELHGGRLDIESRVGGGSTIAVFFPAEPERG
jgi:signal transduction histidine kinase